MLWTYKYPSDVQLVFIRKQNSSANDDIVLIYQKKEPSDSNYSVMNDAPFRILSMKSVE
jgi:hypothetical protein